MRKQIQFVVYSLFAGALFFEWMAPLKLSTDTGRIDIFLFSFAFILIVDILRLPFWVGLVVKPLFLAFIVHRVFFAPYEMSFFSRDWLLYGWQQLTADFSLLLSGYWIEMSPFVRTAFFLLFIWLMEAVMFRYVVKGGRVFWILLLTIFYLSVLDSFTPFEGNAAMVRTFCYGFVMLAFSRLNQLLGRGRAPVQLNVARWFSAVLAFIVLAVSIGVAAPKSEASWPDPVSFITSFDERAGGLGGGIRKVGYGKDDSRLGGPFEQDKTVVFQSVIDEPYYWRGEAKDLYDGQGWHRQQEEQPKVTSSVTGMDYYDVKGSLFHDLKTKTVQQETSFAEKEFSVLFTAGQLKRIYSIAGLRGYDVRGTGNLSGFRTADDAKLTHYKIEVEQPIINEDQLRNTATDYPDDIKEQYLQLPENLPERVKQLAKQVVKDEDNVYDRVKAVENYLKLGSDFAYETEDVPVPPEDRDFVDHFLFDTQRGYCDHFSTSMVVLLRANGIPARWVKGFAPGDPRFDIETGKYEVTVKNADAHSWPEVYFEGVGWLPFEPTPNFSNPTEVEVDLEELDLPEEEASVSNRPDLSELAGPRLEEQANNAAPDKSGFEMSWKWIVLGISAFLAAVAVVLRYAKPRFWRWRLNRLQRVLKGEKREGLLIAYEQLLQLLGRRYGTRKPSQTVREYVTSCADLGGKPSESFVELTRLYEETRYHNQPLTKELWREVCERLKRFLEELR